MHRSLRMVLVLSLAVLIFSITAAASPAIPPSTGCPNGFVLHSAHDHMGEGEHAHIGIDINGNELFCVKHIVTPNGAYHVHIDDIP